MHEVCFILNDDSKEWPDYIASLFKNSSKVNVRTEFDSALVNTRTKPAKPLAKVTVVIASPGHLNFLRGNTDFGYKSLVPDPGNGILFLLGVDKDDLSTTGVDRQAISLRFPNFAKWKQFDHNHTNELAEYTEKLVLKKPVPPPNVQIPKGFKLVPDTARSEDPTTITIFFDEPVAPTATKVKVEALLTDDVSGGLTIVVPAEWNNPYSYSFVTPEHREGPANIRVLVDGKPVGSKPLTYVSNVDKYNALSQIYMHQLSKLCTLVTKSGVARSEVDNCLSTLFDPDTVSDIPVEAFELLFGIYRYTSCEASESELPTLMHFAAKFGLQELTSKLTDLPDAALAHAILNIDRKMPEELARANKHSSLTTFLENFREVNEGIEDLYVKCHGYVNVGGPGNSDGYLKAKNRLLELNSAPDYIVLTPSDVGEVGDDDDDEIYYMYTPPAPKGAAANLSTSDRASKGQSATTATPGRRPVPLPGAAGAAAAKGSSSGTIGSSRHPGPCNDPGLGLMKDVPGAKVGNQQQLVDIMDLYKSKKCSMAEVESLFKQWKLQYQAGSTAKSFKDKQEKLRKMKEDVASAKRQGDQNPAPNQGRGDGAPSLPPRK